MSGLDPRVVHTKERKVIRTFGGTITLNLSGAEIGGTFTSFLEETPPGGGPPPHDHDNEDEWFYPLEGREFYVDGKWTEVPTGTVVFVPRGTVHAFRNPGAAPLKMLIHTAPSGFEHFLERSAEEFGKPGARTWTASPR